MKDAATKSLPVNLTSYDIIKAVAVIIMVIDHVGYYFFPMEEGWRAVGRIGFPVWFFFVGHASGRELSPRLIGGAVILALASLLVSMPLMPFNALVTIILIRLLIDPVMAYAGRSTVTLVQVMAVLAILALPTSFMTEYGTLGLLFALFGYIVRQRDTFLPGRHVVFPVMIGCFLAFAIIQQLTFGFSIGAFLFMAGGTLGTCVLLIGFRPLEFPELSARIPAFLKAPIQFMGRRTLEIYIVHLLLFKGAVAILNPAGYPLFDFRTLIGG